MSRVFYHMLLSTVSSINFFHYGTAMLTLDEADKLVARAECTPIRLPEDDWATDEEIFSTILARLGH